jgi:hypothetical protein
MAWYTPLTWSTGEIVTATKMNEQIYENLRHLFLTSFTYLGSLNAPLSNPANARLVEVSLNTPSVGNRTNFIAITPPFAFSALLVDTNMVKWYSAVVRNVGSTPYYIPPRYTFSTDSRSHLALVVDSSTGTIGLANVVDNGGIGVRTARVLMMVSAEPTSYTQSTGTNSAQNAFPGVGFGEEALMASLAGTTSVLGIDMYAVRNETLEFAAELNVNTATSIRLVYNNDSSFANYNVQVMYANGTSVTGTRYSGDAWIIDTAAAGYVPLNGKISLTASGIVAFSEHPYNPSSVQLARRVHVRTTLSTLTRVAIQAPGNYLNAGSVLHVVRRASF